MAVELQVVEADTWAEAEAHGMNHPPGCFFAGQTPVRYDHSGARIGGGVWIMAAPAKGLNGRNYIRLKVSGQTPREGVLIDCRLFKRDGWEEELGVNWSSENRFPIQAITAVADADHQFRVSIVMDLDNGTDRFHHRCSFITAYRG